jgi:uncharacterized protein (TIRG00374 family)
VLIKNHFTSLALWIHTTCITYHVSNIRFLLVRLTVGIFIGAIALWWAVHGLEMPAVLQILTKASPAWIIASLISVVAVALVKAARWGALYGLAEQQTSFWELFAVLMAAQMVNIMIPIRVGEVIRISLMKRAGQQSALTLSTIVVEKSLDLVAAGLVAISLVALAVAPVWLQERASGILLIGLMLVTGLILVWWLRDWLGEYLARGLALISMVSPLWQERLLRATRTMLEAFGTLTNASSLTRVILWTVSAWLLSLLTMMTLFAAFELHLPVTAAVVMMLAVSSSNIAPSPPALVGVMHLIAVVVLSQYGVAQPIAVGFGIMLNVVTVAPLIVLGSWVLWPRTFLGSQLWPRFFLK